MNSNARQHRRDWYRNRSFRNQPRNQMRIRGNAEQVHRNPSPGGEVEQLGTTSEFAFKVEADGTNRFTISPNIDPERLQILLNECTKSVLAHNKELIDINTYLSEQCTTFADQINQLTVENKELTTADADLTKEVNTLSLECMAKTGKQIRSNRDLKIVRAYNFMLEEFVELDIVTELRRSCLQYLERGENFEIVPHIPLSSPTEEYYRPHGTCVRCRKPAHDQAIDCTCFCGRLNSEHKDGERCSEACWCASNAHHTFSKHIADYPFSHPDLDAQRETSRLAKWNESCQVCGSTTHEAKDCKVFPTKEPKTCICGQYHFYNDCESKCKGMECGNRGCWEHCFYCARPLERHESWECKVLKDEEGYGNIRGFECLDCGCDYVVGGDCLCTDGDGEGV